MYLEIYMIEAKILVLRRSTLHLADQQIRKKHFAKNSIHRTQFNTYILIFPIFASGIRESFACIQYTHTHTREIIEPGENQLTVTNNRS